MALAALVLVAVLGMSWDIQAIQLLISFSFDIQPPYVPGTQMLW